MYLLNKNQLPHIKQQTQNTEAPVEALRRHMKQSNASLKWSIKKKTVSSNCYYKKGFLRVLRLQLSKNLKINPKTYRQAVCSHYNQSNMFCFVEALIFMFASYLMKIAPKLLT